jgi:hypothetical protein
LKSIIRQRSGSLQPELFDVVDVADITSHRDLHLLLGLPIFCLSSNHLVPEIVFENDNVNVQVHLPCSIHDYDLMLVFFSFIHSQIKADENVSGYLEFEAHSLLKHIHRTVNGNSYQLLLDNLARLKRTVITVKSKSKTTAVRGVGFLDEYTVIYHPSSNRMSGIRVKVSDWLVDAVKKSDNVLKIHPNYFLLKSGIAKMLYRCMRKYSYAMKTETLAAYCGTTKYKTAAVLETLKNNPDFPYRVNITNDLVSWTDPQQTRQKLEAANIIPEQFSNARDFCKQHNIDFDWAFEQWQKKRAKTNVPLKRPGLAFLGYCRAIARRDKKCLK